MKDRNALNLELTSLLEKLALQTEEILGTASPSELDVDMARQHLRELYAVFGELRGIAPYPAEEPTAETQEEPAVNIIHQPEPEPVAAPPVVQPFPQAETETEEMTPEPGPEVREESPAPQPQASPGDRRPSLLALFRAGAEDKSVGGKLKRAKIDDLRKAIGINENFIFSKELFAGSITEYEEAVRRLNDAPGLEAAFEILETYRQRGNWDDESQALRMFVEFIDRRHA